MALKSMIRKIDLSANVDMARYGQDLHDFEGFSKNNSLFRNKRLANWNYRELQENEIIAGISYESVPGGFDIYKGELKVGTISNQKYKLEEIESIPSGTSSAVNLVTSRQIYFNKKSYGNGDVQYAYNLCEGGYIALTDERSTVVDIYDYKGNSIESINLYLGAGLPAFATTGMKTFSFFKKNTAFNFNFSGIGYTLRLSFPEDMIGITCYSTYLNGTKPALTDPVVLSDNLDYVGTCFYSPTTKRFYSITELLSGFPYTSTGNNNNFIKNIIHGSESYLFGVFCCGSKIEMMLSGNNNFLSCFGTPADYEYYASPNTSADKVKLQAVPNIYNEDNNSNIFTPKLIIQLNTISTKEIELKSIQHPQFVYSPEDNYSIKNGLFAINYVAGVPESIGHEYKKIIQFENPNSIKYDSSAIYWEQKNKIYKLSIETATSPEFTIAGNYYILFNTTSYKNAFCYTSGSYMFCSCDDWNARGKLFSGSSSEQRVIPVASRLNNNWQIDGEFEDISAQYGAINQPIANYIEGVNYIDPEYTCSSYNNYTVYYSDDIPSSQAPAMVKQGYINSNGYIKEKDDSLIWTNTDILQDVIPVMGVNYSQFADSIFVTINNFTYKLLTFGTSDDMPFLIYLLEESGYNNSAYSQFVLHGSYYTHYPNTNKIVNENDEWVCSTECMVYVGYSTTAAFFYSLFDNNIYAFTGDNTMTRLEPAESEVLKFSTFIDGFGNVINTPNTLNIPSHNMVIFNFTDKVGVLMNSQFCLIEMGEEITDMFLNVADNSFTINRKVFSLIEKENLNKLPIKLETEFYGIAGNNMVNVTDAVYLTVTNLNGLQSGSVKLKSIILQNMKVIETKEKTINLKNSDFNSFHACEIKYQPEVQAGYGFKLCLESDFELSELKFATSTGDADNQTTYRI